MSADEKRRLAGECQIGPRGGKSELIPVSVRFNAANKLREGAQGVHFFKNQLISIM